MDPVQKRRMQNRVAQRNHRLKKRGGQKSEKNKNGESNKENRGSEKGSPPERATKEKESFGEGSREIPSDGQESPPEFQNNVLDNHTNPFAGVGFPMQQQSNAAFNPDCEMMLDSMLDKELSSYQYSVLSGETMPNELLSLERSTNQNPMPRFVTNTAGQYFVSLVPFPSPANFPAIAASSNQWTFNTLPGHQEIKLTPQANQTSSPSIPSSNSGSAHTRDITILPVVQWLSHPNSAVENQVSGNPHAAPSSNASVSGSPMAQYNQKPNQQTAHRRHRASSTKSCTCSSPTSARSTLQDSFDATSPSSRYQYILACIRQAGFENFDSMVSGYYTCQFEKNSVADRAQKVSRGKHLRSMLSTLHEHSREWTTWESRGFREQIILAAEGIYDAEFARLARRREKRARQKPSDLTFPTGRQSPSSGSGTSDDGEDDHSSGLSGNSASIF